MIPGGFFTDACNTPVIKDLEVFRMFRQSPTHTPFWHKGISHRLFLPDMRNKPEARGCKLVSTSCYYYIYGVS